MGGVLKGSYTPVGRQSYEKFSFQINIATYTRLQASLSCDL